MSSFFGKINLNFFFEESFESRFDSKLDSEIGPSFESTLQTSQTSQASIDLAEKYRYTGLNFLKELRGGYSIKISDPEKKCHYLIRDKLGVQPLYYARRDNFIYYSQNLKDFIEKFGFPFEVEIEGLADFLLPGKNPNPDLRKTSFKNIFSLKPGHYLEITSNSIEEIIYWDLDLEKSLTYSNPQDYIEHFAHLYEQSIQRRVSLKGKTAISLSGGLDSSSIFCVSHKVISKNHQLLGVSYTSDIYGDCDEKKFIEILKKRYPETPIIQYRIEDQGSFMDSVFEQMSAIEEPFVDYLWPVTQKTYALAQEQGADVLLTGHWGDQMLFSLDYLFDLLWQGQGVTLYRHLNEYPHWCAPEEAKFYRNYFFREAIKKMLPAYFVQGVRALKKKFKPRPQQKVFKALIKWEEVSSTKKKAHSQHALSLYEIIKSKYHVRCMEWNFKAAKKNNLRIEFPMLDEDLVQFLISIPGSEVCSQGIPRNILRQAFREIVPSEISNRTWKADFTQAVNGSLEKDWKQVVQILSGSLESARQGLVDADQLRGRLQWQANKDCQFSWEIIDYLGLEMWLQYFGGLYDRSPHSNKKTNEKTNEKKIYQTHSEKSRNPEKTYQGQRRDYK